MRTRLSLRSVDRRAWLVGGLTVLAVTATALVTNGMLGGDDPPPRSAAGSASSPSPSPTSQESCCPGTPQKSPPKTSLVATATQPSVPIYGRFKATKPRQALEHPTEVGGPLVFLVKSERRERLRVYLPVRPNGSMGWIDKNDVRLHQHPFRIVVERARHRLSVYKNDKLLLRKPVGIGTVSTPTPGGIYYIKELLRPPNPHGSYGPYAYGLSGFSNTITSFAGGEGVIGIHGTNDPTSVGTDVSHGCIRMRNEDIRKLVPLLPLGTPVTIRA